MSARQEILAAVAGGPRPGGARLFPPATSNTSPRALRRLTAGQPKLSKLQRGILDLLAAQGTAGEVPIEALRPPFGRWTRTRAAAQSRALRRLEARGLIVCIRTTGGRLTHIRGARNG